LVNSLSTRDKLAQLLMVGVTGAEDARAVAAEHHVGGIMIGSWTDLAMLQDGSLAEIAASSGPLPLAVSTDEEGGRVQRLSSIIGSQPPPRTLAATSSTEEVYNIALERGLAMKELGITVDFAPVVDVTDAPDDTVIGDRSFGSNPETVTTFAGEYARGLRDAGVLPVLKHFPGHGHGSGDSHTGGVSTPPIEELTDDLIPYRTLTTQHPVAVMLGHLQVPGLTGTDPASLSKPAYDLLRSGGYGGPPFTGLVYTDDLSSMAAINERYSVPDAVLRSLQAGADVALWITTDEVPAVLDSLEQAVNSGQLSMDRVNESATRVAASKTATHNCGG
jgi:beta-N-acetylhexosaminidase